MSSVLTYLFVILFVGTSFCNEMDQRLASFRNKMAEKKLDGYLVAYADYHASETPMDRDKIRQWLSGFTGTNGDALVTMKDAGVRTDSRYTLQAAKEINKNWKVVDIMKTGTAAWMSERLTSGQSVGADPKRVSFTAWLSIKKDLAAKGIKLVEAEDFADLWRDRPGFPTASLFIHDIKYAGRSYEEKLSLYREKLKEMDCSVGVLTSMSEIAWVLNLRGGDVPYTPVFASFMIVTPDSVVLYVRSSIVTKEVRQYLGSSKSPVLIKEYDNFWNDWKQVAASNKTVFVPIGANYFVYSAVPDEKRKNDTSLVRDLRAAKTDAEVQASRQAHIYDAIALIRLFKILEKKIGEEKQAFNEGDVSKLATKLRAEVTTEYKGPSFPDIVASGTNGALPHYSFQPGREAPVNSSAVVYIDSGGQYLGGTTDTTRVLHFGRPRRIEVEVYTRLLKGVARLGGAVFHEGAGYKELDTFVREPLYQVGLDYGHGSTHGIGIFSSVHENFNFTYFKNFIGSQEPGYYEENNFGMRLENAVVVLPADTKYKNKTETKFFKFSPLTLVPYERKLIDPSIMDESEIKWVNDYHKEVLDKVGSKLWSLNDKETFNWLLAKTKPILKRAAAL